MGGVAVNALRKKQGSSRIPRVVVPFIIGICFEALFIIYPGNDLVRLIEIQSDHQISEGTVDEYHKVLDGGPFSRSSIDYTVKYEVNGEVYACHGSASNKIPYWDSLNSRTVLVVYSAAHPGVAMPSDEYDSGYLVYLRFLFYQCVAVAPFIAMVYNLRRSDN